MTQLLVKLFIKDYDKVEQSSVRTAYGVLSSVVGIICNIILFGTKLIIGFLINSISVTADAFNNLSDAASSIIGFIGVKLAERPADKEHPFGHGRFEYISAFVVSFLILQVGFSCFKSSFTKVINPENIGFSWIMVIILGISVLIKLWLSIFNKTLGKRINSSVMKATSADSLGDVLITSATVISIIIGKVTGLAIDGWMGLIVSVFVLIAGFNIAKDTLEPLLGEAVDHEIYQSITDMVESYDGIIGSHDLIVHNYGPSHIMATIHAEVPNDVNLEEIHEIIDSIERDILREKGIFIVIHMDPIEINDSKVLEKKNMVIGIVKELEPKATIHDFRVVNGENQINLIFDLVVPYSYSELQEQELLFKVEENIRKIDSKYQCVITIENSYIADKKDN
ncbi:cation diffusion facilitator family transporter [Anaerocolumna aminovalerica]|jgi:cation diffusion facilitator family transporter|uniref:Cation diffusion facilitator family transporter n=1 Tax=Anaerocolumna aminovalerica TaxID=1527 RepID=A0A1I5H242_9FIRM|nr:cation diffusion facilitator family transporter [Anaerocolumna aminovalerica]MBU5333885.1 cation diffusion facilitator family transporter [Anaerocolumna aminovalerica]MDU6265911.1 cation diffusion facilitator family transporter [Anaerocolumna aminovalerica]SFO41911.1 cation diffusion facilitator family transporter [Anaerocolumna aminovalerica]